MLLLVTFAPIVAAILIMLGLPARTTALAASLLTLLTSVFLFLGFDSLARGFQFVFTVPISISSVCAMSSEKPLPFD